MKRIFLFMSLLFICGVSKGQDITAIRIFSNITDTTGIMCSPPYIQGFQLGLFSYSSSGSLTDTATVVDVDFGDGTSSSYKFKLKLPALPTSTGTWWLYTFSHTYATTGTYQAKIKITTSAPGSATDSVLSRKFTFSDSCTSVYGKIYSDDNKNCLKDIGEQGIKWIPLRIINTTTLDTNWASMWTDSGGNYQFNVTPGNYNITPMVNGISGSIPTAKDTVYPFCPLTGSKTLSIAALSSYNEDFSYECKPNDTFDASVHLYTGRIMPGDTSLFTIWAGTLWATPFKGCAMRDATVTLTLDPSLTYIDTYSGHIPSSVSGKTITWRLSGSDISDFSCRIKIAADTLLKMDDTVCNTAYVSPATGFTDPDIKNNTDYYCQKVVSAYDPNEKEVSPRGEGPRGFIPANSPLTYTIHFQNTGTAEARNVVVKDTLDDNLNELNISVLQSSHPMNVLRTGKILSFNFKNIYLPDSGSNYYGSMGSVTFGILPVRDLAPGTEIKNRAGIYFDYNDPIITNYALNTIEIPTNIQHISVGNISAQVFPNPANNTLNIKMENNSDFSVLMTDMLGRTVAFQNTNNGTMVVPTQALSAGMYLINIKDAKGNELNTKVVVKH